MGNILKSSVSLEADLTTSFFNIQRLGAEAFPHDLIRPLGLCFVYVYSWGGLCFVRLWPQSFSSSELPTFFNQDSSPPSNERPSPME